MLEAREEGDRKTRNDVMGEGVWGQTPLSMSFKFPPLGLLRGIREVLLQRIMIRASWQGWRVAWGHQLMAELLQATAMCTPHPLPSDLGGLPVGAHTLFLQLCGMLGSSCGIYSPSLSSSPVPFCFLFPPPAFAGH